MTVTRIRIDRLVVDGLPAGTQPDALAQALRQALASQVGRTPQPTALRQPEVKRAVPLIQATAASGTPAAVADAVARGVRSALGRSR